jgi:hypothetical protein
VIHVRFLSYLAVVKMLVFLWLFLYNQSEMKTLSYGFTAQLFKYFIFNLEEMFTILVKKYISVNVYCDSVNLGEWKHVDVFVLYLPSISFQGQDRGHKSKLIKISLYNLHIK